MTKITTARQAKQHNSDLLLKGILCILIGLGVLLSPLFIQSHGMQNIVANSTLVGWFSLVLGCALVGVYVRRCWSTDRSEQSTKLKLD